MNIAFFSSKSYDRRFFENENLKHTHKLEFIEAHLNSQSVAMAKGYNVVCGFVNDEFTPEILQALVEQGTEIIALRCAGFNNVDLFVAKNQGLQVIRVPSYSPHAVAEHAVALIQTLNRKTHRAYNRIREGDFSLDGLLGFDLHQKTIGLIGTGKIGSIMAKIMLGFGCEVIACDPVQNQACLDMGVRYLNLEDIYKNSDIISLHCPLNTETKYIINKRAINLMHDKAMLINTSRGALVDTKALITALKQEKIGYVGLDVYEEEADLFFEDNSMHIIQDDVFARLMTFSNVLITGHQGFFTDTALSNIAKTTLSNLSAYEKQGNCQGLVGCLGQT